MLEQIWSGAQTGVDQISLEVAEELGIPTGGMAPKGFLTEDGFRPELGKRFGLIESPTYDYPTRTHYNVKHSCATSLFGNMYSPGSIKAIRYCKALGKPYIENPTAQQLQDFIRKHQVKILNVAGNRGSKLDDQTRASVRITLTTALEPWRT